VFADQKEDKMSVHTLSPRRKGSLVALAVAAVLVPPTAQARHGNPAEDGTRQPPTRIITVKTADTFDWSDAGIGAGGTIGVLAVAAGTGLLLQRQRNQTRAA
jgi:hypothetical protein